MDISKSLGIDERPSLDIISTLPQSILETILCLLPTYAAARTSILSRDWRYKWSTIPKLEFLLSDHVSKRSLTGEEHMQGESMDEASEPFNSLLQILLSHKGPIHEFTLDINSKYDFSGLDRIILHLSKNHTIKKLKLWGSDMIYLEDKLPISVFLLHHLMDLNIFGFHLDYQPIFNGFNCLRSLSLYEIRISSESLLHLLSNCPSLKTLTLHIWELNPSDGTCTIIQLFKCLPVIEHLKISGLVVFEWLVVDAVPQEIPTLLFHLKYFCFESSWHNKGHRLEYFLLGLIKCSPSLEKIELKIEMDCGFCKESTFVWEDYNVRLEHLKELVIELAVDAFSDLKPEVEFVKFILARSPKLKKVSIFGICDRDQEESEALQTLLQAPRKSECQVRVTFRNSNSRFN